MYRCLVFVAMLGCLTISVVGQGGEPDFVDFGRDRLAFPKTFALLSTEEMQHHGLMSPECWKDAKKLGAPFRSDTELGIWYGLGPAGSCLRDKDHCAIVKWDSIGFFLDKIENAAQFEQVLSFIRNPQRLYDWREGQVTWQVPDWRAGQITWKQFVPACRIMESLVGKVPLKVVKKDLEVDLLNRGCFVQDGTWFVNYLALAGASIVEYKFVIQSPHNRVAWLRRVLVAGPWEGLQASNTPGFDFNRRDDNSLISQTVTLEDRSKVLFPERYRGEWHGRCCSILQLACRLEDAVKETWKASKQGNFENWAKDAVPVLILALDDPSEKIRQAAEESLLWTGSLAASELRQAANNPNERIRDAATRLLKKLSPLLPEKKEGT